MQVAQWSASKSYLSNSFVCSPPNSWIQTTQGIQRPVHQIATLHLRQLLDCASEGMPLNNFELPLRNSAVSCDGSKSGYLRGNLLAYCMQSQGPVLEHVKATACMQHMLPWSLTGSNMHATLSFCVEKLDTLMNTLPTYYINMYLADSDGQSLLWIATVEV